jgi:hypothetical protein
MQEKMTKMADRINKVDDTIYACYFASKNGLSYRSLVASEKSKPKNHSVSITKRSLNPHTPLKLKDSFRSALSKTLKAEQAGGSMSIRERNTLDRYYLSTDKKSERKKYLPQTSLTA